MFGPVFLNVLFKFAPRFCRSSAYEPLFGLFGLFISFNLVYPSLTCRPAVSRVVTVNCSTDFRRDEWYYAQID